MDSIQDLTTESLKQELDKLEKEIDRLMNEEKGLPDILFNRFCKINKELLLR